MWPSIILLSIFIFISVVIVLVNKYKLRGRFGPGKLALINFISVFILLSGLSVGVDHLQIDSQQIVDFEGMDETIAKNIMPMVSFLIALLYSGFFYSVLRMVCTMRKSKKTDNGD